jgi:hypothetical protein
MRILIAGGNERLLESISITFACQFSVYTASTHERCSALLARVEFDLAIVCEKLTDGPGLRLLGQIAQSSPRTLRVFAARQTRLQLLEGKLAAFGLFRTLAYPIDARRFRSMLTLACFALVSDETALRMGEWASLSAPAPRNRLPRQHAAASRRPNVASKSPRGAIQRQQSASVARSIALLPPQPPRAASQSALSPPQAAQSGPPPLRLPSESKAFQRALARREAAKRATTAQTVSRPSERRRQSADDSGRRFSKSASTRTNAFLGATIVAVFMLTTVAMRLFDASTVPASGAQVMRIARFNVPVSLGNSGSAEAIPPVQVARSVTPPTATQSASAEPQVATTMPVTQIAASGTPIADPSTFGYEASEAIYPN